MPLTAEEESELAELKRQLESAKKDEQELRTILGSVVVKTAVRQALDNLLREIRGIEKSIRDLESRR